jgi:hypothetical protein
VNLFRWFCNLGDGREKSIVAFDSLKSIGHGVESKVSGLSLTTTFHNPSYKGVLVMNALTKLSVALTLAAMAAAAYADTLAGGAIYGGSTQLQGVCYLYNAGGATVGVTTNSIVRQGSAVPLVNASDDCGNLAPGATCGISANLVNNLAHSCRMVVTPSGANVRGNFEVRDAEGRVLNDIELR